jgi:hypothetical protein
MSSILQRSFSDSIANAYNLLVSQSFSSLIEVLTCAASNNEHSLALELVSVLVLVCHCCL